MNNQTINNHALEYYPDQEASEIGQTLWWMQGRHTIIRAFMEIAQKMGLTERIMDIGCGSGENLSTLSNYGEVYGVEKSLILSHRAISRKIAHTVINQDFLEIDRPTAPITIFTLFDVLEHIEDDGKFLKKIPTISEAPHLILISVPACQWLYSPHDVILHHYRRYSRPHLEQLLRDNRYTILKSSYFMFFLFPIVALSRLKERLLAFCTKKQSHINLGQAPEWINPILAGLLRLEAFLSKWVRFPIGVWLFVLAKYEERSLDSLS